MSKIAVTDKGHCGSSPARAHPAGARETIAPVDAMLRVEHISREALRPVDGIPQLRPLARDLNPAVAANPHGGDRLVKCRDHGAAAEDELERLIPHAGVVDALCLVAAGEAAPVDDDQVALARLSALGRLDVQVAQTRRQRREVVRCSYF